MLRVVGPMGGADPTPEEEELIWEMEGGMFPGRNSGGGSGRPEMKLRLVEGRARSSCYVGDKVALRQRHVWKGRWGNGAAAGEDGVTRHVPRRGRGGGRRGRGV